MEIRSDSDQYTDDSCDDNDLVGSPQILERLERLHEEERLVMEGIHPELLKKFDQIETHLNQRKFFNRSCFNMEIDRINRWKEAAMELVRMEAQKQQQELQESLMSELDEKKRMLDVEKASMDLSVSGDVFDSKPTTTRKLRRRLHDNNNTGGPSTTVCASNIYAEPLGLSAKRKKAPAPNPTDGIRYLLEEDDIMSDIMEICRGTGRSLPVNPGSGQKRSSSSTIGPDDGQNIGVGGSGDEQSVYIDDGRLYYDHKWFTKGQAVFLLGKDAQHKFSAIITHVGMQEVHLKRQTDLGKVKINLQQLKSGKYALRKRN